MGILRVIADAIIACVNDSKLAVLNFSIDRVASLKLPFSRTPVALGRDLVAKCNTPSTRVIHQPGVAAPVPSEVRVDGAVEGEGGGFVPVRTQGLNATWCRYDSA